MFRFRLLRASFPNIAYFLFKFMVSFVFEISVLFINDLFLATTYRVYYDYCALRQFVTVSMAFITAQNTLSTFWTFKHLQHVQGSCYCDKYYAVKFTT